MSEEFRILMKNIDGKISCVIENMQILEETFKKNEELRQEVERLREALKLLASTLPSKDSLPHSTRTKYHELHDVVEKALAPQIEEK